jgi:CHASE3 domain sensor protein
MFIAKKIIRLFSLLVLLTFVSCQSNFQSTAQTRKRLSQTSSEKPKVAAIKSDEIKKLLKAQLSKRP